MHNRIIVYVRVCIICTYAHVAPHCGCVWCGRQDAKIMRRIYGCGWCYGASRYGASLTMARRAHDLRRAPDVNANGTHAQSCNRVCARVCYTYVRVHGAALRMCLVRPPGCRLCGAYAVAVGVITHELVVACGATGPIATG